MNHTSKPAPNTAPRPVPGKHESDGGSPPWCVTCTVHYRCPIRFPCGTYRSQHPDPPD
jgi:hypothetical protein